MKAIALSLYGDQSKYCFGAVRNAQLALTVYPGWKVVVFADTSVPRGTIRDLEKYGAEVREQENVSMFTRFLINDDPTVERYLIRDADSRLNEREAGVVREWIDNGKAFHAIRDHPYHPQVMMGGLWGGTTGIIKSMASLMHGLDVASRSYGADQGFLKERVWPIIRNDCYQRDLCTHAYFGAKPFPAKFSEPRFCGEIFDANDNPNPIHSQMRINWMTA